MLGICCISFAGRLDVNRHEFVETMLSLSMTEGSPPATKCSCRGKSGYAPGIWYKGSGAVELVGDGQKSSLDECSLPAIKRSCKGERGYVPGIWRTRSDLGLSTSAVLGVTFVFGRPRGPRAPDINVSEGVDAVT